MKRLMIALVAGMLGGTAFGFALGIFVYPFWFLRDVAHETLAPGAERTRLADGAFIHVTPSDPVHWGKGKVTVYREDRDRTVVHLHEDFEVGPGPRFHVYLVDHAKIRGGDDFRAAHKVDLGRLHAFKGSQIYAAPPGTDATKFSSVVIWCKEFGVLITTAGLTGAMAKVASPAIAR